MPRDLIILGDSIHGLEMADIVERVNTVAPTWNLLGFLSASDTPSTGLRNGYPVLGSWRTLENYPNAGLIPDNEWPLSHTIPNERLISLIDPTVFVSRTAKIGLGCVVYPHCFIGANAVIGDYVFCLSGSIINHDDVLENRVVVASGVTLAGSVHVEESCYLGQSCTVRQNIRIGRKCLLGMGSVIVRDVPPESVIVGNPGRYLRPRYLPIRQ